MPIQPTAIRPRPVVLECYDRVVLGADLWRAQGEALHGIVIINPATGVAARYYHRYAAFLARNGFDVLTYDYRGIGRSATANLRGCGYRWRDWGERDFDAVLRFARSRCPSGPLAVVGHSFGGLLPGLCDGAQVIDRMLTVGAQFGDWADYAPTSRVRLFLKWHVAMPVLTALCGYFPGSRLGWSEDLPAGVAYDWGLRRMGFQAHRPDKSVAPGFAAMTAWILAVAVTDDAIGSVAAVRRTLDLYVGATRVGALLSPRDFGLSSVGHFGLFHDRHAAGFWLDTLLWLRDGLNPWPDRPMPALDDGPAQRTQDIVRYY